MSERNKWPRKPGEWIAAAIAVIALLAIFYLKATT
jgi:hypothetical protein